MPWRPSRVGTAQSKMSMPRAIPSTRSSGSPIPSRCLGAGSGRSGAVMASTAAHLLLVAAERAADRDPVDRRGRDRLGRLAPQVLVGAALDDPEDRLPLGPWSLVPIEAAVEPAVGALGRARRCSRGRRGTACTRRRRGRCRSRARLHLHRALRREEMRASRRCRSGSGPPPRSISRRRRPRAAAARARP